MKSKTVLFFLFLFKYIIAEADYTHTVDKTINEFRIQYMNYSFYQRERYEISWEIILPPRDFDNFYVIFDYYIHDEDNVIKSTVDVLGIKKEEFRNKIVAKVETKDEFKIYIKFPLRYLYSRTNYVNYVIGYSFQPFLYYGAQNNFSFPYCINDNFRMVLDISELKVGKKYYFYNSFNYTEKPGYKLFEEYDGYYNYQEFDGNLSYYENLVFEFTKPDKKYKKLFLDFKGAQYYNNVGDYISMGQFNILEKYTVFDFHLYIPGIAYIIVVFLITIILYCIFHRKNKIDEEDEQDEQIESLNRNLIVN